MKAATAQKSETHVQTTAQARRLFNRTVKSSLGISAIEFISNYQNGMYEDRDDCDIMSLLMLLPFTGYSAEYAKSNKSGK
ncbi:MAG: hypothetical protein Q8T09_15120 [Candidatus Melainabacteria bacterium]|nr:hypothetical protein [Candidatus Melainabacteria bacterium]